MSLRSEVPTVEPVPNLLDKYGGTKALKPLVTDFCARLLASPATRRCYDGLGVLDVLQHGHALLALALGKPVAGYDFGPVRQAFADNHATRHAYEALVLMARQTLLAAGFISRDVSIAINVLDMHSQPVLGIGSGRLVTSPYAGVDRRRFPRTPQSPESKAW